MRLFYQKIFSWTIGIRLTYCKILLLLPVETEHVCHFPVCLHTVLPCASSIMQTNNYFLFDARLREAVLLDSRFSRGLFVSERKHGSMLTYYYYYY